MSEVKNFSELKENQINQAVDVFVEGFHQNFTQLTKDKGKLHRIFKSSFNHNMMYAYVENDEAIGVLGIKTHENCPITLNKEVFLDTIGGIFGKMAYKMTLSSLENATLVNLDEVYVDYLATAPAHRGKGTGTKLIEYAREIANGKHLMIEVLLKNPDAKRLYERIGFRTIKVRASLLMRLLGIGKIVTMKLED